MTRRKPGPTGSAAEAAPINEQPSQGGSYVRDRATGKLVRQEWTTPAGDPDAADPVPAEADAPIGGDGRTDPPLTSGDAGETAAN